MITSDGKRNLKKFELKPWIGRRHREDHQQGGIMTVKELRKIEKLSKAYDQYWELESLRE